MTTELPYAAEAESSLSYNELEVSLSLSEGLQRSIAEVPRKVFGRVSITHFGFGFS